MTGLEFAKAEDKQEMMMDQIFHEIASFKSRDFGKEKLEDVFAEHAEATNQINGVLKKAEEYFRDALKKATGEQKDQIRQFYSNVKNCSIDARKDVTKAAVLAANKLAKKQMPTFNRQP